MLSKARSLVAAQQDAARRVAAGRRFSVRLPVLGTVQLPPPDQLAFFGVLAGLAALELIDWPVAVAMGVGSAVVSRHLSDVEAREAELETREAALEEEVRVRPPAAPENTQPAKKAKATNAKAAKAPAAKAPAAKTPAAKTSAAKAPATKTPAAKTSAAKAAAAKTGAAKRATETAAGGKPRKTTPRKARGGAGQID